MGNIFYFLNDVLRITACKFSLLVLAVNFTFLAACRMFSGLVFSLPI